MMEKPLSPLRTLAPSFRVANDTVQISREDFKKLLEALLAPVDIDEAWYVRTYPDVAAEIDKGLMASARQHFAEYGYAEGRLPAAPDIDEPWYLRTYPDVAVAVAQGELKSALEHYVKFGAAENRALSRDAGGLGKAGEAQPAPRSTAAKPALVKLGGGRG